MTTDFQVSTLYISLYIFSALFNFDCAIMNEELCTDRHMIFTYFFNLYVMFFHITQSQFYVHIIFDRFALFQFQFNESFC